MAQAVASSGRAKSRKKKAAPKRRKEDREAQALRNEVLGIAIMATSVALMLALGSFHPQDVEVGGPAASSGRTHNLIGPVGASLADIILYVFGLAGFLLPVTLALPGFCFLTGRALAIRLGDAIGYPILVLFCAMAAHLWMAGNAVLGHDAGGMIGTHGAEILRALLGTTGAYIVVYAGIALTFVITTRISLVRVASKAATPLASSASLVGGAVQGGASSLREGASSRLQLWLEDKAARRVAAREAKQAAREAKRAAREAAREAAPEAEDAPDEPAEKEPAEKKPRRWFGRGRTRRGLMGPEATDPARISGEFVLGDLSIRDEGPNVRGDDRAPEEEPVGEEDPSVLEADDAGVELEDPLDKVALEGSTDTVMAPALADEPEPEPVRKKPVVKSRRVDSETDQLEIPLPESERHDGYVKPPLHLLNFESKRVEVDPAYLQAQAEALEEALSTFRVDGRVTEIHPGPVVTMFEFEPAPGVRISKIANLADDVAMALKAMKVRIVAPIPGKGVVGFEVPNKRREMVFLKEIIGSPEFRNKKHNLPMALGKDIHGQPTVTDLSRMPHLLVAGTTGSGKSVGVNAMITSLIYRMTPDEVRFIMVDPKMLELSIYEGIPHLLLPVVTDPMKASMALKWAVDEMERRYELMKNAGVRDIRGHNRKLEKQRAEAEAAAILAAVDDTEDEDGTIEAEIVEETPANLPYIVVVIDEFADLMMVAGKEVEYCVARIAQKARAAGIHLILATQRPSTDVITGVIKANFPTRIAFQVSSAIDSRTILSTNGAESLLGKGDMLYMPPGTSRLTRVHGAFVDEKEIHEIVEFVAHQQEPDYLDESILEEGGGDDLDGGDDDIDEMYEEAVRTVYRDGRASTSHLQRRLSVGYNRAARMVDQMERDGLVGPSRGAKPREINKVVMAELIERWDST